MQYTAKRHWFNNEVNSFNDDPTSANFGQVYRERLSVDHDQRLSGNVTDLIWNSNFAGMDNRFAATFAASSLQFNVTQDDFFNNDFVSLVNPDRGFYGAQQTKNFYTHVDNVSLSFEDRLKLTKTFALIGGIRVEQIKLDRTAFDVDGVLRTADGYPFSKTFSPDDRPRRLYLGGASRSDLLQPIRHRRRSRRAPTSSLFGRRTPLLLTTSRTYETGVKQLFWDKRAEWTFSAFDIERRNVYVPETGTVERCRRQDRHARASSGPARSIRSAG